MNLSHNQLLLHESHALYHLWRGVLRREESHSESLMMPQDLGNGRNPLTL
jgi:hypothetical protein